MLQLSTVPRLFGILMALAVMMGTTLTLPSSLADNDDETEVEFKFDLSGDEEVPPVETDAFGMAEVELKVKGDMVMLKVEVEVCDIDDVTQSHIHTGAIGTNGPVVLFLFENFEDPFSADDCERLMKRTWTLADLEDELIGITVEDFVEAVVNGNTYINVHTVAHPPGEIRGQVD